MTTDISEMNQKKNLIKQQYLSSKINHVLCIDITKIGKEYGSCLVVLDLAARSIVGHCYKTTPLDVQDILDCLSEIIKRRSFLPKIEIIHSDRESYFKNTEYYQFMEQHAIQVSRGSKKGHDNQVIERTFRTLKGILKEQLQPNWKSKMMNDPLEQSGFSLQQIETSLHKAIEFYNNKPHRALYMMTPNHMEESLFENQNKTPDFFDDKKDNQLIPLLDKNDESKEACQIREYKQKVISNYAGNWAEFFMHFRKENKEKLNEIISQNTRLYEHNLKLQESLTLVRDEMEVMKKNRLKLEREREKRQNAVKQIQRDSVSPEDFDAILDSIKSHGFVSSRKRIAFLLLYATGLRVSNLLCLTVNNIRELLDQGKTIISLNKSGYSRHPIIVTSLTKKLFNKHLPHFIRLMENKVGTDPFFTTQIQLNKPINRCSFDEELNQILKKVSSIREKHIRTHSFRATMITELLENTPIHIVQDIIGHRNIGTTVEYNRNRVNEQQITVVLNTLEKKRKFRFLEELANLEKEKESP